VFILMKIQQLSEDVVHFKFIPFALKDNAKKWLYSLLTNSINARDGLSRCSLKKYFIIHKTIKIRNEINQFRPIRGVFLEVPE